jgi:sugar-phosphatase
VDAVIFDLDGVLVDSNPIVERHWQIWAERRGINYELIAASHHGRPTVQIMKEVAPHLDATKEAACKENAEADDLNGLVAFPGAHRILMGIPPHRRAIATSGTRRTATKRLGHTLLPIPDILITADDVQHGKPDPEPYLKAISGLGFPPNRCLVIEDAPAGIEAAKAAGATVIAVTTSNPPEKLTQADFIVGQLDRLSIQIVGTEPDALVVVSGTK